jgi:hypothetical protein
MRAPALTRAPVALLRHSRRYTVGKRQPPSDDTTIAWRAPGRRCGIEKE